jgi:uncharacterized membrane protein
LISSPALQKFAQYLFAIGIAGFGIQHLVLLNFIAGRPLPMQGEGNPILAVAIGTGILLLATAITVIIRKKPFPFLISTAAIIFLWSFLRYIPVIIGRPAFDGTVTAAGKALAVTGSCLILTSCFRDTLQNPGRWAWLRVTGLVFIGLFLIASGIQHFIYIDFVAQLVPSWIPAPVFWAYFAGIALIAGGLGLMIAKTRKISGTLAALMIFVWMIILHIPRVVTMHNANEWTSLMETMVFSSGLLIGAEKQSEERSAGKLF